MLVLIGIAVIVVGFMLRFNALLVVLASALVTGWAAGIDPVATLAAFGKAFNTNRIVTIIYIVLPVIGLLERHGLRERAQHWIAGFRNLSLSRLLVSYLAMRQLLSMFGLYDIAGHAQTVRPLLAPMSEQAAARDAPIDTSTRMRVRALAAATDNIGRFFGEDVFLAFAGVLLIQRFYAGQGIALEPFAIARWALPTAIAAFVIHALRVAWAQRAIDRAQRKGAAGASDAAR